MNDRFDQSQEHKLKSMPDEADDGHVDVRRMEVVSGTVRRRQWPAGERMGILVESLKPGANVSAVARPQWDQPAIAVWLAA